MFFTCKSCGIGRVSVSKNDMDEHQAKLYIKEHLNAKSREVLGAILQLECPHCGCSIKVFLLQE